MMDADPRCHELHMQPKPGVKVITLLYVVTAFWVCVGCGVAALLIR